MKQLCWIPLLIFLAIIRAGAADDIKVEVEANRQQIYLGESIILTVKISGTDRPPEPDLSGLKDCQVRLRDTQLQNYRQTIIVNGRITQSGFNGRVFTYEITPRNTGVFKTGPVTVAADAGPLSSAGPDIEVTAIEKQDRVRVAISASRESVLVDEPFDIVLSISVKRLDAPYADIDPINPADPPALNVPFLEPTPIAGLEGPDITAWLQQHVEANPDRAGFAINRYTLRNDPFDMQNMFNMDFDAVRNPPRAKFAFERTPVEIDGGAYFRYTLKVTYTPREEKSYTFGPAVFKGPSLVGVGASGQGITKPTFAVGPACTVRVIPPPEQGRPASYIGVIGTNLTADATLDAQTCKVGDPLTLRLTVSGTMSQSAVHPPPLNDQTNLTANFRVYDDNVQTERGDNDIAYRFALRPTRVGTLEIPPIAVSYYDAHRRSYRTIFSRSIPVRVNEVTEVADNIIIDTAPRSKGGTGGRIDERPTVAPMNPNPLDLEAQAPGWGRRDLAAASIGPLAYALVVGIAGAGRLLRRRRLDARRRHALRRALGRLRKIEKTASRAPRQADQAFYASLKQYLMDRFDRFDSGLTPADVRACFLSHGMPENLTSEFCGILESHFNAGYTPAHVHVGALLSDIRTAMRTLPAVDATASMSPSLRGASTPRKGARVLSCVVPLFLLSASVLLGNARAERQFLWNEATARMYSAQTPDDFLAAAESYAKLADTGVRNGPVLYNLGTALLMAGRHEMAERYLLSAERCTGVDPEIRRNLLMAIRGTDDNRSLPWHRFFLFWHYDLGYRARMRAALASFAVLWLAMILRFLGSTVWARRLAVFSFLLLILFGSSVATSLVQEKRERATPATVLLSAAMEHATDK